MLRFSLLRCSLPALILCLGAANLPAQEPSIILPPIPSVLPPDPPNPETLPPPPQLEWAPLAPQGAEELGSPVAAYVTPPEPEASIAPPPPPAMEAPLPDGPDPAEVELAQPEVEMPGRRRAPTGFGTTQTG